MALSWLCSEVAESGAEQCRGAGRVLHARLSASTHCSPFVGEETRAAQSWASPRTPPGRGGQAGTARPACSQVLSGQWGAALSDALFTETQRHAGRRRKLLAAAPGTSRASQRT